MEPNTYEQVSKRPFVNAQELMEALLLAVEEANQDADRIVVSNDNAYLILEREALSDGSIVYNLLIK